MKKTLLLITESKNGIEQILVENEAMIYRRVEAMLRVGNYKTIQVFDGIFKIYEKNA